MIEIINILTEVLFLLLLGSALVAGAWSFYYLIYKERHLFRDDLFSLDLMDETRRGFEIIENRLQSLEDSHKATAEIISTGLKKIKHEN